MILTIAIPTYNRAARLDRSLHDILKHVKNSNCRKFISIFVSNNGSTDSTANVLYKYKKKFSLCGVGYSYQNLNKNCGFDFNVLNCYENSPKGFVWLFSDDDNLTNGAIDQVYNDSLAKKVSFLYYNFDQEPYGRQTPYVKDCSFYNSLNDDAVNAILKVFIYPKISSFVLLKDDEKICKLIKKTLPNLMVANYGYIHCAIALQAILSGGKFYLSSFFAAYPDEDFEDHIDFPPYVGGELNEICEKLLKKNDKSHLIHAFTFQVADPLITSLNTLATFYKGKILLTPELKSELIAKVRSELKTYIKSLKITLLLNPKLLFILLKVLIFFCADNFFLKITGKRLAKEKDRSKSYEKKNY